MADKKQNNSMWTVIIIVISIIGIGSRIYKFNENKNDERRAQQRQVSQIRKQQQAQAKIEDKIFIPEKTLTTPQSPLPAPDNAADSESPESVTPKPIKPDPLKSAQDKPITLSPFINFIGHVHTGRRNTVGPTPAMSLDGTRFAIITAPYTGRETGALKLTISDIEYVTDRKVHYGTGLEAKDGLALHKTNVIDLDNSYSQNILSLTALNDGNWLWLKGNPYFEFSNKKAPQAEPMTCWFTWSGQETETPNKTCLDPAQERGELLGFTAAQDGSVGLFTQLDVIKENTKSFEKRIALAAYRLIAVDLKTGELISESSIRHRTGKTVELGAHFLDTENSSAIIYESLEPEDRGNAQLNVYVWDISENKIIGDKQSVFTGRSYDPTKINNVLSAFDNQNIQLLYERGASQIIIDSKSGLIKRHIQAAEYTLSTNDKASRPRARSGFPLANGRILFIVSDGRSNHSWQVFNQDTQEILGQQVEPRLNLNLLYPHGQRALSKSNGSFRYEVYEIKK